MTDARLLRNFAFFLLGFGLSIWIGIASAGMTGYQMDGRCYDNTALALEAFNFKMQSITAGADFELCGGAYAPVIAANPTYTGQSAPTAIKYYYTQLGYPSSETCATASTRYMGLPPCDPETQGIAFSGTNALFLVLSFFYSAMLGFKTGYRP